MHIGCFDKKMDNSLQRAEAMSPTCPLFRDSTVIDIWIQLDDFRNVQVNCESYQLYIQNYPLQRK